jgi:hypothetical protein
MAINTALFRICQVVNDATQGSGAPDDSRRMQQGWLRNQDSQHQIGLQNMSKRGALSLIAGIVAAVYDCRSSRLSSGWLQK